MNKDNLKGGLADKMSKKDISKKFKVSIQKIDKEISMGVKIEMEHVNSKSVAKEITMDHLAEIPDYYTRLKKMEKEAAKKWDIKEYTRLKKMEKEAAKKWDIKESTKVNIKRLFREEVNIQSTDETPDVTTFRIMYNDREVGSFGIANVTDMDMTLELVFIQLRSDHQYKSMEIISETILAIWDTFKDAQKIILTPQTESRTFWHKMGANRLNDEFLMIVRGH